MNKCDLHRYKKPDHSNYRKVENFKIFRKTNDLQNIIISPNLLCSKLRLK